MNIAIEHCGTNKQKKGVIALTSAGANSKEAQQKRGREQPAAPHPLKC